MRSSLLILTLAALSTLACKREDTTNPDEAPATTSDADADAANADAGAGSDDAEPNADSLAACEHMGKLMQADLGDTIQLTEEEIANNAQQCAKDIDLKRASMPAESWDAFYGCAMAAETVEAAAACG